MTTTPQAPVMQSSVVTVLDVYTRQVEMSAQLAILTERLGPVPDHERRIRDLENIRGRLIGACLTLSALAGGGAGWAALVASHR